MQNATRDNLDLQTASYLVVKGWLQDNPSPGTTFWGLAPVLPSYIWAVGSQGSPLQTLTARRVNDLWYAVPSPNVGRNNNELRAVTVVPGTSPCAGGNNWAVGYYLDDSSIAHTLAMNYYITPACNLSP